MRLADQALAGPILPQALHGAQRVGQGNAPLVTIVVLCALALAPHAAIDASAAFVEEMANGLENLVHAEAQRIASAFSLRLCVN